jgi:hypothetical protein
MTMVTDHEPSAASVPFAALSVSLPGNARNR